MRLFAAVLVVALLRSSAPHPPPGSETAAIPDRAAEAFVAALQLYARQPTSVAQSALRTFARKQEPLPYLPEFVLPDFSSQGARDVHRVVAHMGAGQATVHPYFLGDQWREIRVDISAANRPDIVADMVSVRQHLADASVDAVYSAHSLEHLPLAEAARALRAFWHILKPGGVLLVTVPDTQAALSLVLSGGAEAPAYHLSADGSKPVTPIDLLFGDQRSIALGNRWMQHRMGWTEATLRDALLAAGYAEVQTLREFAKHWNYVDLWALALKDKGLSDSEAAGETARTRGTGKGTRGSARATGRGEAGDEAPSVGQGDQEHGLGQGELGLGSWNLLLQGVSRDFGGCVQACGHQHLAG